MFPVERVFAPLCIPLPDVLGLTFRVEHDILRYGVVRKFGTVQDLLHLTVCADRILSSKQVHT